MLFQEEKLDLSVLTELNEKADIFNKKRKNTWFALFSKLGFTDTVIEESKNTDKLILVDLQQLTI